MIRQIALSLLVLGILSRIEPQNVRRGMDDGIDDPQAPLLTAQVAFPKNKGLRLDYIFATQPLPAHCISAEIDRQERKGAKSSDHAPVIALFDDEPTAKA